MQGSRNTSKQTSTGEVMLESADCMARVLTASMLAARGCRSTVPTCKHGLVDAARQGRAAAGRGRQLGRKRAAARAGIAVRVRGHHRKLGRHAGGHSARQVAHGRAAAGRGAGEHRNGAGRAARGHTREAPLPAVRQADGQRSAARPRSARRAGAARPPPPGSPAGYAPQCRVQGTSLNLV